MNESLPLSARRLLRVVSHVVPAPERGEWMRSWEAELWHARCGQHRVVSQAFFADLSVGLTLDAWWLRRESWRRQHHGTAALCLLSLASVCALAGLIGVDLAGNDPRAWSALRALLLHSAFGTPLVLFVGGATGWRYIDTGGCRSTVASLRGTAFLGAKTVLVLLLAAGLSTDLCLPFHAGFRGLSDVLQQWFFVLLALVGLRWSFNDQEGRCKHCMRALASPERVGRPSHNLLEWAGTEQVCVDGHGALNSPEMVSSWCEHSRWVERADAWAATAVSS